MSFYTFFIDNFAVNVCEKYRENCPYTEGKQFEYIFRIDKLLPRNIDYVN